MKIQNIETQPFETIYYQVPTGDGQLALEPLHWLNAKAQILPDGIEAVVVTSDLQGISNTNGDKRAQILANEFVDHLLLMSELGDLPPLSKMLLILAGDLFASISDKRRGLSGNVSDFLTRLSSVNELRSLVVLGNHDVLSDSQKQELKCNKNFYLLADKPTSIGNVKFGGVNGVIGKNGKNNRIAPDDYLKQIKHLKRNDVEVLVIHEGPQIEELNLLGHEFITDCLNKNSFPLVISGHAHWDKAIVTLVDSQILNVDGRVIVIR